MTKQEFLKYIENFLKKTGMSPTVFGLKAVGDGKFVFRLRGGRECREKTQEKVFKFIAEFEAELAKAQSEKGEDDGDN